MKRGILFAVVIRQAIIFAFLMPDIRDFKALFRLGARARCSGTGTILSTSLNAVLKANTIKTVPSTGT